MLKIGVFVSHKILLEKKNTIVRYSQLEYNAMIKIYEYYSFSMMSELTQN